MEKLMNVDVKIWAGSHPVLFWLMFVMGMAIILGYAYWDKRYYIDRRTYRNEEELEATLLADDWP